MKGYSFSRASLTRFCGVLSLKKLSTFEKWPSKTQVKLILQIKTSNETPTSWWQCQHLSCNLLGHFLEFQPLSCNLLCNFGKCQHLSCNLLGNFVASHPAASPRWKNSVFLKSDYQKLEWNWYFWSELRAKHLLLDDNVNTSRAIC